MISGSPGCRCRTLARLSGAWFRELAPRCKRVGDPWTTGRKDRRPGNFSGFPQPAIARLMTVGRDLLSKAETVTVAAIGAGVLPSSRRAIIADFHLMIRRKAEEHSPMDRTRPGQYRGLVRWLRCDNQGGNPHPDCRATRRSPEVRFGVSLPQQHCASCSPKGTFGSDRSGVCHDARSARCRAMPRALVARTPPARHTMTRPRLRPAWSSHRC
jgi:hypothetical protein